MSEKEISHIHSTREYGQSSEYPQYRAVRTGETCKKCGGTGADFESRKVYPLVADCPACDGRGLLPAPSGTQEAKP